MSIRNGLKIKKYIDIEDTSEVLLVSDYIQYNPKDINKYREMFNSMLLDDIFYNCTFDDDIWFSRDYKDESYRLNYDIGIKPKINTAIKCYIVAKIDGRNISLDTAKNSISGVKRFLLDSSFLNDDTIYDYALMIKSYNDTQKSYLGYALEFIDFYGFENAEPFIQLLESINVPRPKYRLIPSYHSLLLFDTLLQAFFENTTNKREKEKYYPILLWWRITNIIPMRPVEFCLLSKECNYFDKNNNCYYITVERRKTKNGKIKAKKIPPKNKLEITKEIYDLIEDYKEITKEYPQRDFLLSYDSYFLCAFESKNEALNRYENLDTKDRIFNPNRFNALLHSFYDEILKNRMNITVVDKDFFESASGDDTIQKIQPGDTRHIAMCGLMLQGFNPFTIAQLAGHNTIREQVSYFSHMESYIDSNTYLLAKQLVIDSFSSDYEGFEDKTKYKQSIIDKEIMKSIFHSLRKVVGGRCQSKSFPNECILDDCIFCDQFLYDDTLTQDMIDSHINKIEKAIKSKVNNIKLIVKKMIYTNELKYDISQQELLKKESNLLNSYTNKKVIIEGYKLHLTTGGEVDVK